tara:strand:- start:670 stop:1002 length:333 start_codon:yes stop_codon:yes gene_type:complete
MDKNIQEKLKGYKKCKSKIEIEKFVPGDRVRYITNNEFRGGGIVKLNKYPDYVVLMNPIKNVTWCMQIKSDPTLIVYLKKADDLKKENEKMREIYEKFKKGEIVVKKINK